jgi:hypothetical protein
MKGLLVQPLESIRSIGKQKGYHGCWNLLFAVDTAAGPLLAGLMLYGQ